MHRFKNNAQGNFHGSGVRLPFSRIGGQYGVLEVPKSYGRSFRFVQSLWLVEYWYAWHPAFRERKNNVYGDS